MLLKQALQFGEFLIRERSFRKKMRNHRHDARVADGVQQLVEVSRGHLILCDGGHVGRGALITPRGDMLVDKAIEARLHCGIADFGTVLAERRVCLGKREGASIPQQCHQLQFTGGETYRAC